MCSRPSFSELSVESREEATCRVYYKYYHTKVNAIQKVQIQTYFCLRLNILSAIEVFALGGLPYGNSYRVAKTCSDLHCKIDHMNIDRRQKFRLYNLTKHSGRNFSFDVVLYDCGYSKTENFLSRSP